MKKLLLIFFLMGSLAAFSQGTVTGTLIDSETGETLPSANVVETGTTNGTVADMDGNFTLEVSKAKGSITISYVGYLSKKMAYTLVDGTANLGSMSLDIDDAALGEIVIIGTGVVDLADDRRTPVAVSTVTGREIQARAVGNVEFTEAMKNMPSVYVANQGGGFGDSSMSLRGFDDSNTAFLLNGQPINSVEDGRIFWSNWSGMSDVANAVQVQRGLGSSKLAISSVGGTVNIVSKTTDQQQGGFARFLAGNDSYFKGTAAYNTGVNDKGWAFSFMMDYWTAHRKYAEGTAGEGQNYLFSVGYKPNETHAFNLLLTGAPQWHDQNFSDSPDDYDQYGEKYNGNSGWLDGERYTERRNYYHKPIMNLNWDYNISETMDLSTVLYASYGRGGGTGMLGRGSRVRNSMGQVDFDATVQNNIEDSENGVGNNDDSRVRRASVNNHNWYGLISNLNIVASEDWAINVGIDGRLYKGTHFRQLNDLLGLTGFEDSGRVLTNTYGATPWDALFDSAPEEERVAYDYSENINNIGAFGQAEYAVEHFTAFVQGAFSSQSLQREGRLPTDLDGLGKSEKVNKTGYNVKGGLSYSINTHHQFFANAGYYSRQPFLDNIFVDVRSSNELVAPEVENEEITGFEGGYRFQNSDFNVNIDVYHTNWGNRFVAANGPNINPDTQRGGGETSTYRLTDVTEIHKGIEFEARFRPDYTFWTLRAFGSIGNWKYDGSTPYTLQNDDTGEVIEADTIDLTGTKVGSAPQTSFGAGLVVDVVEGLSLDASIGIYTDLYAEVDPSDVAEAAFEGMTYQSDRLDAYSLVDAGLTYKTDFGGNGITFRANVYNFFNSPYLSSQDAFGVYLGVGRTYNASLRYNF